MRRFVTVCVAIALVAAACGGGSTTQASPTEPPPPTVADEPTPPPPTPEPSPTPEPPGQVRVVSYNAGLAEGFVPYATLRQPLVVNAISELSADLVFVQEVWSASAVTELVDATADAFPYTVFPEPIAEEGGGDPSCTVEELADLEACIQINCPDVSPDELVGCVLASCAVEFGELCATCQACIGANVGKTVEEAVANCTLASSAFAYGGSLGIGLLSSGLILETDILVLDSSLNRRAVVYALVETEAFGPIHVFGTHLSAVFQDIPYPGEGSWEQEQADQIQTMLEFVDSKAAPGDPVVLLGDFNTGPSGELYESEVEANYNLITDAMLANPYVEAEGATCTFCGTNPLIGSDEAVLIDHIFTRGFDGSAETVLVLDEAINLDVDGTQTPAALSDHYGLLMTLTADS